MKKRLSRLRGGPDDEAATKRDEPIFRDGAPRFSTSPKRGW